MNAQKFLGIFNSISSEILGALVYRLIAILRF